jgi:hypothetical protein
MNITQFGKKAANRVVTATNNGLMLASDYVKLTYVTTPVANTLDLFGGAWRFTKDPVGRGMANATLTDGIATARGAWHNGANCYFDGTNWQRQNIALPAQVFVMRDTNRTWEVYHVAAGANPITWNAAVVLPISLALGWTAFGYAGNWTDNGGGESVGAYRVGLDGRTYLKGLSRKTVAGVANDVVTTLPAAVRPGLTHRFTCPSGAGAMEVVVNNAGQVFITGWAGVAINTYISFAPVQFDVGS